MIYVPILRGFGAETLTEFWILDFRFWIENLKEFQVPEFVRGINLKSAVDSRCTEES
ncbi:hypothetical protein [Aphanizomenon flos-aquae]|uniref:hypothetical protein n=1 Tax=Aphanizomenon flos-aquae TaxID=1176 RepID=UPI0016817CB6|nr:hypothetical protein [Aphanizomenon flos-aquae]